MTVPTPADTAAMDRYQCLAEHRRDILTESLLVLLNLGVIVWLVDRQIPAYWGLDRALSLTVSFVIVQTALISLLLVSMFGLKIRDEIRAKENQARTPEGVALVTAIARGEARGDELRQLRRRSPLAIDPLLAEALGAQRGEGQQRLARAVAECGALDAWRVAAQSPHAATRCEAVLRFSTLPIDMVGEDLRLALEDPEELVAVEAGRALLAHGTAVEARVVFDALPGQTVLVQALMLASLRRHAGALALETIPAALESTDEQVILMALSALRTWKRMLPVPGFTRVLLHQSARVRVAALEALPYALLMEPPVQELRRALGDTDPAVRAAAAVAAGRKAVKDLLPELAEMATTGGEPGRCAAISLTCMGEAGIHILEAAVVEARGGEKTATEALERFRLRRGPA